MNNLNSILIEGNLVKDPLHRTTPKGTSLCTFSVACNRYLKQESGYEQQVSFFDVETWAKLGDTCHTLGRKGRGVRIIGHLKQDRWIDTDGKNRSRIVIVGEHAEFKPDFKLNSSKASASAAAGVEADDTFAAMPNEITDNDFDPTTGIDTMALDNIENYEAVSF